MKEKWMTISEYARLKNTSTQWIYSMINRGIIAKESIKKERPDYLKREVIYIRVKQAK